MELGLPVDRPREVPVVGAVLYGDDTAGGDFAGTGIPFANVDNMLNDLLICGGNGGTHPVCRINVTAKDFRIAEFAVNCLSRNRFPQIPRFSAAVFQMGQIRCVGLVAVAGGVCAAAVGDEYQIVFDQVNGLFFAVLPVYDLLGNLFAAYGFNDDVLHVHAVFDLYAMGFQIFHQRQDHALILVVFGEPQCTEIRQPVNVVHIAAQIPLHLQRTGPTLKGEHGLPVQPEVGVPECVRQNI